MSTTDVASKSAKPARVRGHQSTLPKRLSAFANAKLIGVYKCRCGCVHYGISEKDALLYVASLNRYLASCGDDEILATSGGRSISVERFNRCFFCSTDADEMMVLHPHEQDYSISHQPVIVRTTP